MDAHNTMRRKTHTHTPRGSMKCIYLHKQTQQEPQQLCREWVLKQPCQHIHKFNATVQNQKASSRVSRAQNVDYCSQQRLTILLPPLMKMVTALVLWQSSMTSIRSFMVPKDSSRTMPALPSFSGVSSSNRGTMRPPVAMAISWNTQKIISITPKICPFFFY